MMVKNWRKNQDNCQFEIYALDNMILYQGLISDIITVKCYLEGVLDLAILKNFNLYYKRTIE